MFNYTIERGIREHHLWLSVFLRNERNRFTRAQRVTAGMAMVYLGMLVNALWYFSTPEKPIDGWQLGPIVLSWTQLVIGLVCNLVALPPILLAIFMFRKSRRRVLRRNRVELALEEEDKNEQSEGSPKPPPNEREEHSDRDSGNGISTCFVLVIEKRFRVSFLSDSDEDATDSCAKSIHEMTPTDADLEELLQTPELAGDQESQADQDQISTKDQDFQDDIEKASDAEIQDSLDNDSVKEVAMKQNEDYVECSAKVYPKRTKFYIHWVFKYVSWILCLLMIFFGIFFLCAFAIQFGNDLTYQWFSSMLVTFFTSIIILDPFKVFL